MDPQTSSPRLGAIAWTGNCLVAFFVVGLGTWSVFAPLSSAAIASGVVEPETSRKTVQHLEGGIVRQILVKNGQKVLAGQTLIKLDDTKARSQRDGLWGQFWDARIREARLISEQTGSSEFVLPEDVEAAAGTDRVVQAILESQRKIFATRRTVKESQIVITRQRMGEIEQEIVGLRARKTAIHAQSEILRREIDAVTPLVQKKLERQSRLLELNREGAALDGQLGETEAQISQAGQNLNESRAEILKFENDWQDEIAQSLRDTENEVLQLGERMRATGDQLARTEIRAPLGGVVTNLRIHTKGGVIGAGEPLLDLVPGEDRLVVTVHVRPDDINVVHVGLPARVHLLPYDQRRVPLLAGRVEYVSADRLSGLDGDRPYYVATIRIDARQLAAMKDVLLLPGMPVQALIETGQSTVALYALRPLIDSFDRAFREN
jgi:HlyD family secretion protein